MTNKNLKILEQLLIELRSEIGAPVIVIPQYMQDGTYLAVYDKDGNNLVFQKCAPDLKACLNAYKNYNHFLKLLKTVPLEHQDRVIEQEREMNFRQFLQSITIDGKIDYQKIIDNPKAFFEYLELTFNFVVKDSKNSIQLFKQEPYIKEEYKDWFNNTEGVGYYLHILALPDEKWKESLIKRPE